MHFTRAAIWTPYLLGGVSSAQEALHQSLVLVHVLLERLEGQGVLRDLALQRVQSGHQLV